MPERVRSLFCCIGVVQEGNSRMGGLGYVHSFVLEYGISLIDKIFFCEICTKKLASASRNWYNKYRTNYE